MNKYKITLGVLTLATLSPKANAELFKCMACTNAPENAVYTSSGDGSSNCSWTCKDGYTLQDNKCNLVQENSWIGSDGKSRCNYDYYKKNGKCIKRDCKFVVNKENTNNEITFYSDKFTDTAKSKIWSWNWLHNADLLKDNGFYFKDLNSNNDSNLFNQNGIYLTGDEIYYHIKFRNGSYIQYTNQYFRDIHDNVVQLNDTEMKTFNNSTKKWDYKSSIDTYIRLYLQCPAGVAKVSDSSFNTCKFYSSDRPGNRYTATNKIQICGRDVLTFQKANLTGIDPNTAGEWIWVTSMFKETP